MSSTPTTEPYKNTAPAARSQCGCSRRAASHSASGSPKSNSNASAFQYPTGDPSRAIRPDPTAGTALPSSDQPSAAATTPLSTNAQERAETYAPSASPTTASPMYTSPRLR